QVGIREGANLVSNLGDNGEPSSIGNGSPLCQTGRPAVCDDVILNDQPSGPGMKKELWIVPDLMRVGFSPIVAN
ncbi:MAG: hypothetical protein O7B98_01675, partial [Alphaproteobacteria bacterium]|nr:hypothetical protein [Alphaproteobacteria bacterium]